MKVEFQFMSEIQGASYSPEKVTASQLEQPEHSFSEGNSLLRKQGVELLFSWKYDPA